MNQDNQSPSSKPLVSIGLPVYNGDRYLRKAVETVLAQSYDNLELIIADNASTDQTAQICREMAAQDARVRLYVNDTNVGAAANYNLVFNLARGKYFKWAAHDDVLAPSFVERAVEVLESDPGVVLCCSRTRRINDGGEVTGAYPSDEAWDCSSASRRFQSLVFTPHACVAIFGLIRRTELARTPLIGPYVNSDRVLLAELGLRGRIHEIPEDLFSRRDHPGSSLRSFPDPRKRVVWFDPSKSASFAFPEWNEMLGYAGAVSRAPASASQRAKYWSTVAAWSLSRWRPLLADFKYAALGIVARKSTVSAVRR
jgi:glycosyltransferase involved in cell wall biosynthesis